MSASFEFLRNFPPLHRAACSAAHYASDEPNHALYEIRRFGEKLTELLAYLEGVPSRARTTHDRQAFLRERGLIPDDVYAKLVRCRRVGNDAVHNDEMDPKLAEELLEVVHALGAWFVERQGQPAPPAYVPDAFGKPMDAAEQERQLRTQIEVDLRIPMTGVASRISLPTADMGDLFVAPRFGAEPTDWLGLAQAVHDGSRVAVAGPGGSGKSTLARALAHKLAADPEGPVPLLLPLANVDGPLRSALVRRVRDHLFTRLDGDVLQGWLEQGHVVLILDGLDEATDPQRLADAVEGLANAFPKVGILITGRPTALNRVQLKGFSRNWIQGWSPWQARDYIARQLGAETADKIVYGSDRHEGLWELLQLPLMALLLVLVWRERGEIPQGRGELLDAAIRTMLETWPTQRRRTFGELTIPEQLAALERLARATLEEDFRGTFASFNTALGMGIRGERWLEHVIDETGLLSASGADSYEFFHLAVRDRLALSQLQRDQVDVVPFVVERATGGTADALAVDLVTTIRDRPGLAAELIARLSARDLPDRGAWYGASRAWWLTFFRDLVRAGLPLDDRAEDGLLRFLAEDRLRIYRAINAHEPMRFGDESRTPNFGGQLTFRLHGSVHFAYPISDFMDEARAADWMRRGLRAETGENLRAVLALALGRLDEDEVLRLLDDRVGTAFWLWPRSPAGCVAGTDQPRPQDAPWPGERLALAASASLTLDQALEELSGASDWLGRALSYLTAGAGRGLAEAIVVLLLRQTLSLGFRGASQVGAGLPPALHSGPWPCTHLLTPQLGVSPLPGLGGPLERFRGPLWLGWRDSELASLVVSTGLRTPTGLVRFEGEREWPDTSELDGLPFAEVAQAEELLAALAERMGLTGLGGWMFDAAGQSLGAWRDQVALTLQLGPAQIPSQPMGTHRSDLRQTWLAELVAASLVTRGMPESERICHLQQRLQCRATSNLWTFIEARALSSPEPVARELMLPALLWAQRSLTGTRPITPWIDAFIASQPDGWLARALLMMSYLGHRQVDQQSRRRLRRELKGLVTRAGGHPAAVLLRQALGRRD